MEKVTYDVTGMTCSSCVASVENSVKKMEGINNVSVSLMTNSMIVEFDDSVTSAGSIAQTVIDAGYEAAVKGDVKRASTGENVIEKEIKDMRMRLIVSMIFMIPLMYISMGEMIGLPVPGFISGVENALSYAFIQFILVLPIMYVNRKYFQVGFKSLFRGSPNMDSLIAIGSTAAVLYGIFAIFQIGIGLGTQNLDLVHKYSMDLYIESAGTILGLITLGKYLEVRAKGKTSDAIQKLVDLSPQTALVQRNGLEEEILIEDVIVGDVVIVKPGYVVPVDGVVIEGNTFIDESALTGESLPVEKVWVNGPKDHPTIEVQLYRNGEVFGDPVSLENGITKYTWLDLDKTDSDGIEYVYTVDELTDLEDYIKEVEGSTIKNTYTEKPVKEKLKNDTPSTGLSDNSTLFINIILIGLLALLGIFRRKYSFSRG